MYRGYRQKKAILKPGQQENGLYFLSKDACVDNKGCLVDIPRSEYVWISKELVSENDKILVSDIIPKIILPLSTDSLGELVSQLEGCLKHYFIPSLLVVAGTIMSFHYQQIVATYG